ncbi:hypothetical protein ACLOJK_032927 [Asimina triloba]
MGIFRSFNKLTEAVGRDQVLSPLKSLVPTALEEGFLSAVHQLPNLQFSPEIADQNPIFTSKQFSVDPTNTLRLVRIHQEPFFHSRFQLGFRRSIHFSARTQNGVEAANESPVCDREQISANAEKICRVISSGENSNIQSSLDHLGIEVSSELVEEALQRLSNAGVLALWFFRWAEKQPGFKHTTESFHALIEALGKIKQFKLIWKSVDTMKSNGLLTRETFGLITRRYARARKVKGGIEAFEQMEKYGFKPELSDFNRLIDTISKSRNVKSAQELFDSMKKRRFSPDLKTYTILLEGWGHQCDLLRLKEVYQEMKDEGFEPDAVTFGILINAHCKARRIDEAVGIYNEMVSKNCTPTPHIYCTLINGLGSHKRLDEALEFFELSKSSGFGPEIPTYNAVVGSYCWVRQFDNAFKVVDEMKRCGIGPNSRTYDIIINHLIKATRMKDAYSLFQRMGNEIDCKPGLNTYTMMISMLCADGRLDLAMRVWKQMNSEGVLPCMHMFSALINGLCDENRLDEACKYFQEMLDKGLRPPGQLFSYLKEALLDGGKKDLASAFSEKLDKLSKTPLEG